MGGVRTDDPLEPTSEETALHQLSLAYTAARGLDLELLHLIDRAKYYNDPPTLKTLETLKKSIEYLVKLVE